MCVRKGALTDASNRNCGTRVYGAGSTKHETKAELNELTQIENASYAPRARTRQGGHHFFVAQSVRAAATCSNYPRVASTPSSSFWQLALRRLGTAGKSASYDQLLAGSDAAMSGSASALGLLVQRRQASGRGAEQAFGQLLGVPRATRRPMKGVAEHRRAQLGWKARPGH
jgi:hypothetical protein